MLFDAFKRANDLGADVLLWGRTRDPLVQVVLLRGPDPKHQGFIAYCFDVSDGGFYNGTPCGNFADGQAAFLDKLNRLGACH